MMEPEISCGPCGHGRGAAARADPPALRGKRRPGPGPGRCRRGRDAATFGGRSALERHLSSDDASLSVSSSAKSMASFPFPAAGPPRSRKGLASVAPSPTSYHSYSHGGCGVGVDRRAQDMLNYPKSSLHRAKAKDSDQDNWEGYVNHTNRSKFADQVFGRQLTSVPESDVSVTYLGSVIGSLATPPNDKGKDKGKKENIDLESRAGYDDHSHGFADPFVGRPRSQSPSTGLLEMERLNSIQGHASTADVAAAASPASAAALSPLRDGGTTYSYANNGSLRFDEGPKPIQMPNPPADPASAFTAAVPWRDWIVGRRRWSSSASLRLPLPQQAYLKPKRRTVLLAAMSALAAGASLGLFASRGDAAAALGTRAQRGLVRDTLDGRDARAPPRGIMDGAVAPAPPPTASADGPARDGEGEEFRTPEAPMDLAGVPPALRGYYAKMLGVGEYSSRRNKLFRGKLTSPEQQMLIQEQLQLRNELQARVVEAQQDAMRLEAPSPSETVPAETEGADIDPLKAPMEHSHRRNELSRGKLAPPEQQMLVQEQLRIQNEMQARIIEAQQDAMRQIAERAAAASDAEGSGRPQEAPEGEAGNAANPDPAGWLSNRNGDTEEDLELTAAEEKLLARLAARRRQREVKTRKMSEAAAKRARERERNARIERRLYREALEDEELREREREVADLWAIEEAQKKREEAAEFQRRKREEILKGRGQPGEQVQKGATEQPPPPLSPQQELHE